jgi:hypothetical protein
MGYLVIQLESVWVEQNVCRGKGGKVKTLSVRSEEDRGKYEVVRYDMKEEIIYARRKLNLKSGME